jgi:hypothetical protein
MKLFLESRLAPDDPSRETVHRNFRANLEGILDVGEQAGVPIVLSTVAVNLKDFAPLAALPARADTNPPPELPKLVSAAVAAQSAGDWPAAIQSYQRAAEV